MAIISTFTNNTVRLPPAFYVQSRNRNFSPPPALRSICFGVPFTRQRPHSKGRPLGTNTFQQGDDPRPVEGGSRDHTDTRKLFTVSIFHLCFSLGRPGIFVHHCFSARRMSVRMHCEPDICSTKNTPNTVRFGIVWQVRRWFLVLRAFVLQQVQCLTLRLLMSYNIYIYGAPSKARNANVVYIWTYVWQRWNSLFLFAAQCFNTELMQRGFLCHIYV